MTMKVLLMAAALFGAVTLSACDKNSIAAPCFSETIGGGSGGSCGADR